MSTHKTTHKVAEAAEITTPAVTVTAEAAPTHSTPAQDALAALPARKEAEAKAQAEQAKLEEEGKLVVPAPLIGYEQARAQAGTPADEADAK